VGRRLRIGGSERLGAWRACVAGRLVAVGSLWRHPTIGWLRGLEMADCGKSYRIPSAIAMGPMVVFQESLGKTGAAASQGILKWSLARLFRPHMASAATGTCTESGLANGTSFVV